MKSEQTELDFPSQVAAEMLKLAEGNGLTLAEFLRRALEAEVSLGTLPETEGRLGDGQES